MKDVARELLDKIAIPSGGFVDIRLQNSLSLMMQVRKGITTEVGSTRMGGAGVRALIGGAWGFASTAEVSKETLQEALNSAIRMAKVASQKVKKPRVISDEYVFEGVSKLQMDVDPKTISLEDKIALTLDFEKNIREVDDKVALSAASYTESIQSETILSSLGTNVTTESGVFRLYGSAVGREGNLQQSVSDDAASSAGIKTILEFDTVEKGVKLGEKAVRLLSAAKPSGGKTNIIMDPSLVGVFIHEAFGHACEADGIITNNSILSDKLNTKIGVDEISVIDDPTIHGLRGSFKYDSEGTLAKTRKLVTNGVLTEFFHTLETATILEAEPNGAGRAMNFGHPPLARMGNTYIDEGDKSLEELFEIIGDGVYLVDSYGGYVNPAKGAFMFSSQQGYVIEKGEQTDLTQNVSMSGMIMEVLENTIGVGKGIKYDAFNGTCGKGGQWVPVTAGGPSLAVKDVVLGGR
ncbi:MAG: TldD/PmbA family protein [Candidatus Kariarchaeaceae archaeon]